MFMLVTGPLSMVNAPLWGGYADAYARGDFGYIRKTLHRSLLLTFLFCNIGRGRVIGAARAGIAFIDERRSASHRGALY